MLLSPVRYPPGSPRWASWCRCGRGAGSWRRWSRRRSRVTRRACGWRAPPAGWRARSSRRTRMRAAAASLKRSWSRPARGRLSVKSKSTAVAPARPIAPLGRLRGGPVPGRALLLAGAAARAADQRQPHGAGRRGLDLSAARPAGQRRPELDGHARLATRAAELEKHERQPDQLALDFSAEEKRQLQANMAAWRRRLAQFDAEIFHGRLALDDHLGDA